MGIDRRKQLEQDGYELVRTEQVALPHSVWKVDLDIEIDRELRLAEETVLRLVATGIDEPRELERLMGLDEDVIVPDTVVRLMTKGMLLHNQGLAVTPLGRAALRRGAMKETRPYPSIELRHNRYGDELRWNLDGETKRSRDVAGMHHLPAPARLLPVDVDLRSSEVQELVNRYGLPFNAPEVQASETRDIVRMRSVDCYEAWRVAELEVWHSHDSDDWQWRLLVAGGEERATSEVLTELHAGGAEVLPLVKLEEPLDRSSQREETISAAVSRAVSASTTRVLAADEHRGALQSAVERAKDELFIVSPWLNTRAVDDELVGWLESALKRNPSLRIRIGYGIEENDRSLKGKKGERQERALKRLRSLGRQYAGRLEAVKLGCTHEKVIICDLRFAIVTSFNWLSYNPKPGYGLRRETGLRLEREKDVRRLRDELEGIFESRR